ncbi:MAG: hypothetical protein Kow0099_13230 [Candidatus Abyssubacteria bacterium]
MGEQALETGAIIRTAATAAYGFLVLRRNPELLKHMADLPRRLDHFLSVVRSAFFRQYFEVAGNLPKAFFLVYHSSAVYALILVVMSRVVLRPLFGGARPRDGIGRGWKSALGIVAGLTAPLMLALTALAWARYDPGLHSPYFEILAAVGFAPWLLAGSFLYAVFVPAIEAEARGRGLSLREAAAQWEAYFVPLLAFRRSIAVGCRAIRNAGNSRNALFCSRDHSASRRAGTGRHR